MNVEFRTRLKQYLAEALGSMPMFSRWATRVYSIQYMYWGVLVGVRTKYLYDLLVLK